MLFDYLGYLTGSSCLWSHVPYPAIIFSINREQPCAVRAEYGVTHPEFMRQGCQNLTALRVPNLYRPVACYRKDQPAVRTISGRKYTGFMLIERGQKSAAGAVPDLCRPVIACSNY